MITIYEARERADVRLEPVAGFGETSVSRLAATCEGTDVQPLELLAELALCDREMAHSILEGTEEGLFKGQLLRTFWLGYEYGREATL